MSAQPNYFKIGLFVLVGVTLGVIGVVLLGGGRLFEFRSMAETYINESVQGIDVGTAVRYRGVQIGNVKSIDFVHNIYNVDSKENIRYVLVRFSINPSAFPSVSVRNIQPVLMREIQRGLRVRMTAQGLTGTSYLELDYFDPENYPPQKISWSPIYYWIPSAPSAITRLSESLDRIMRKLESIQFETIIQDIRGLLSSLQKEVEDAKLKDIHQEIDTFLQAAKKEVQDARIGKLHEEISQLFASFESTNKTIQEILRNPAIGKTIDNTQGMVVDTRKQTANLLAKLTEASTQINQTLQRVNKLLESKDLSDGLGRFNVTLQHMDQTLLRQQRAIDNIFQNTAKASEELREMLQDARQYPAGFLFGNPPAEKRKP